MSRRVAITIIVAAVVAAAFGAISLSFAAERPTAPEVAPTVRTVDDEAWAGILARHLAPDARFDYRGLRASPEDRELLTSWLADQARVDVSALRTRDRKAFWINLYNAATVELILRHWPVKSILRLGLIPGRAWKWTWIRADGRLLSLDAIEHEILRPEFGDPRIHFAVNCASASCPPLRREPYRGRELDEQLDTATRDYLGSPSGLSVRIGDGRRVIVTVSKIFDWFREDFDSFRGGVRGFLEAYAPPETASLLRGSRGNIDVRYASYDWSLNAPPGTIPD